VIEGGAAYREPVLTGEALHRSGQVSGPDREAQEETRGQTKRCEVADDSVVVMKFRPAKAGDSVEDKTGTTHGLVRGGRCKPKAALSAKGGSLFEGHWNSIGK
jgi:hypothetical protein